LLAVSSLDPVSTLSELELESASELKLELSSTELEELWLSELSDVVADTNSEDSVVDAIDEEFKNEVLDNNLELDFSSTIEDSSEEFLIVLDTRDEFV